MDRQQKLRDDRTSDCRSFGSNYQPLTQSRKISIGIMVDSSLKPRATSANQDVAAAPSTEDKTPGKENTFKDGSNRNGVTVPTLGKQTEFSNTVPTLRKQSEFSNKENSPWVSTRSLNQKLSSSPEASISKQALRPATSNVINRPNGTKEPSTVPSVRYFENEASTLQASNGTLKKFCRRTNGMTHRDGAPATAQETMVPEKDVVEDKTKIPESAGNATLKVKLWEILGTVSSPVKQLDSPAIQTGKRSLKPGQVNDGNNVSPVVEAEQNPTAVGNDSDSPTYTTVGPVTRSRTRRKSSSKVEANKLKHMASYTRKEKHTDDDIFSFEEGWSGKLSDPISGNSSMPKVKDIKPRKLSYRKHDAEHETKEATERSKRKSAAKKSLSPPQENTTTNKSLPRKKIELVHPDNDIHEKDPQSSPVIEKNMDHREDSISPYSKNSVDPQDDHCSPTFKMNTVIEPSPELVRKTGQEKFGGSSPAHKEFNAESIRSFKYFLSSKSDYYEAKEQVKSPDDVEEHEDSPVAKSVRMNESPIQNRDAESASGTSDSENSEYCSSVDGDKCILSDVNVDNGTTIGCMICGDAYGTVTEGRTTKSKGKQKIRRSKIKKIDTDEQIKYWNSGLFDYTLTGRRKNLTLKSITDRMAEKNPDFTAEQYVYSAIEEFNTTHVLNEKKEDNYDFNISCMRYHNGKPEFAAMRRLDHETVIKPEGDEQVKKDFSVVFRGSGKMFASSYFSAIYNAGESMTISLLLELVKESVVWSCINDCASGGKFSILVRREEGKSMETLKRIHAINLVHKFHNSFYERGYLEDLLFMAIEGKDVRFDNDDAFEVHRLLMEFEDVDKAQVIGMLPKCVVWVLTCSSTASRDDMFLKAESIQEKVKSVFIPKEKVKIKILMPTVENTRRLAAKYH